jgi:hypothetical protein
MKPTNLRFILAGLLAAFVANGFLGVLFSSSIVQTILYDPQLQSELFLTITPTRNIPVSVAGLIALGGIHGYLFRMLESSLPGNILWKKGVAWGVFIWATYWLAQEWFIYITLLGEPIMLALFELLILFCGSILEGVLIAVIGHGKFRN